jgi:paraquat-inducible protein B
MNKSPAFRVGLFVVVGLAVLVVGITYVLGGQLLTRHLDVEMRFQGSVYGLQSGSPVVFRGVRIGRVSGIGLAYDDQQGQILIPVSAMIDQVALQKMVPSPKSAVDSKSADAAQAALQALVQQGLSARLATQSLLTGQLYVDLDLRSTMVGHTDASQAGSQPTRIPTMPTTIQAFMAQLEELDLKGAFQNLAGLAASTRQLVADPKLAQIVGNVAALSQDLRELTRSLQQQVQPLSSATQDTLAQTRQTAQDMGKALGSVAQSADRMQATVAPDAPLVRSFQRAADELANTAAQLRNTTGEDAALVRNLERAAQDVARTARQLGDLARLLERQPDALLRGRSPETAP